LTWSSLKLASRYVPYTRNNRRTHFCLTCFLYKYDITFLFSSHISAAPVGLDLTVIEVSRLRTLAHTTLGRTSLDEGSAPSQRPLPDTTQHSKPKDINTPARDSNPQSKQESGRRPRGHRDRPIVNM